MTTSINVASPHDRTGGYPDGGTNAPIGLLIAVSLVCFLVATIYLSSLVDPVQLKDVQLFAGLGA